MFEVFRNAWKVTELRKKILYTLFIIIIFRFGSAVFVPFLDSSAIAGMLGDGTLLSYLDTMTGGSLSQGTLFAMSITPYINASIIIQLLTVAIPALERLSKEGEEGRKKLNTITKLTSLGLALFQAIAFYFALRNYGVVKYMNGFEGVLAAITIVSCFVAGASLIIWLGDQINEKGIGNGISMILFAGIVARGPSAVYNLIMTMKDDMKNAILVPVILIIFVAMIALVVLMTNAERRIPVQYAKRVVGRKMYGGQSSNLPIKVNMTGVMPIIFANSIITIPATIAMFTRPAADSFWGKFFALFESDSILYAVLTFILLIAFAYFYISISFNPVEVANNLKTNGGSIPGIRPGRPTAEYITKILNRVTFIGALLLSVVAVVPLIINIITGGNLAGLAFGGSSVIIVVGVVLETFREIEAQMTMRNYKGFLE